MYQQLKGKIIIAPPSSIKIFGLEKLKIFFYVNASGWMTIKKKRGKK